LISSKKFSTDERIVGVDGMAAKDEDAGLIDHLNNQKKQLYKNRCVLQASLH
jgi:hypothetical protein